MKDRYRWMLALLLAAAMFTVFSWPLPRHFADGIPSSSSNVEKDNARAMIPGDHLQFLYHMWLAKDTFAGPTPLFYNLYEFNTGDDAARREVRPYYLPFSLFFTLGALLGGHAFGWNFAMAVTLWITCAFAWKLARRYHPDEGVAALLAALPLALPYPWITLMGGSPTGFAMMWVPILLYGIDRWIADRSVAGAALVGAAIFFAEWGDTHVFFFNVLLAPCWLAVTYLYRCGWRLPRRAEWWGWLKASWVLLLFAGLAAAKALSVHQGLQGTAIGPSGRSEHEVALFSHGLDSLLRLNPHGDSGKIYVGLYGLALLAAAFAWGVMRAVRLRRAAAWCLPLVLLGVAAIFLLSTGVKNPFGPRAWRVLVKLVPPYGMIRQPDKIFCILPALLVAAGAMALPAASRTLPKWGLRAACLALLLPLFYDYQARLNPTLCLLDDHQGAYAAVAADAQRRGEPPRALVLPLWPGDSHFSSIYQHYVSLYRIRMVNGYRPTARKEYIESIFDPYSSMNSGCPSDAQLDGLLDRGIRYLLLHEDAFPEKVSSFPVGATLVNLLQHPRLQRLDRDGPVWSFAILDAPAAVSPERSALSVPVLFPVRFWDWGGSAWGEGAVQDSDGAIGRRFARVSGPLHDPVASRFIRTAGPWPMEWHIRVRGQGRYDLLLDAGDGPARAASLEVDSADWVWQRAAVPGLRANAEQTASVLVRGGNVDLDALLLTRAGWAPPAEGETLAIPAVSFFRAGFTLDDFSGVAFRRRYDPNAVIFYSRHLYLEPGTYEVALHFDTDAPAGTLLGHMTMGTGRRGDAEARAEVRAGAPAMLAYRHADNRFFHFGFDYARRADLVIRSVAFSRQATPAEPPEGPAEDPTERGSGELPEVP